MGVQLSPTFTSVGKKGLGIGSSSPHYSEKKGGRGSAKEFFFFLLVGVPVNEVFGSLDRQLIVSLSNKGGKRPLL